MEMAKPLRVETSLANAAAVVEEKVRAMDYEV